MTEYLGKQANPYDYGYLVEMMPDSSGESLHSVVEKRYTMGRFSHENGVVMPDLKTVYFGDDGTNTVLFKFVADEAGDLSAGTLYAAKATQNDDESFGLEWIELGKGNDDDIAEAIATMQLPSKRLNVQTWLACGTEAPWANPRCLVFVIDDGSDPVNPTGGPAG